MKNNGQDFEKSFRELKNMFGLDLGDFVVGVIEYEGERIIGAIELRDLRKYRQKLGMKPESPSAWNYLWICLEDKSMKHPHGIELTKTFGRNYSKTIDSFLQETIKKENVTIIRIETIFQKSVLPLYEQLVGEEQKWRYKELRFFPAYFNRLNE